PMSWKSPARRRASRRARGSPSASPMPSAMLWTRCEWPAVYGSRASTVALRLSIASSALCSRRRYDSSSRADRSRSWIVLSRGVLPADGLAELAVGREALPDAGRLQARPRERAVGAPHLDADHVALTVQDADGRLGQPPCRDDLVVTHHDGAEHPVDVLRERRLLLRERLAPKRVGENGAEEECGRDEHHRRREDEQPHECERPRQPPISAPDAPQSDHQFAQRGIGAPDLRL